MTYFATEEEVYEHLGKLFQELITDPELVAAFTQTDTIVQYRYREPAATITVKIKAGEDPQVDLGESKLVPEVVMAMEADVAHRFWLGRVNVTVALARGEIKAKGPVAKILRLVPLIKPVFPRYVAQLEASGREDLASVTA